MLTIKIEERSAGDIFQTKKASIATKTILIYRILLHINQARPNCQGYFCRKGGVPLALKPLINSARIRTVNTIKNVVIILFFYNFCTLDEITNHVSFGFSDLLNDSTNSSLFSKFNSLLLIHTFSFLFLRQSYK